MVATAYSDQPTGGFPDKTNRNDNWIAVPVGPKTALTGDGSEYHNNGGGQITISMDSECALLVGPEDSGTAILQFHTVTDALSGYCCSGFGPGGDGVTAPEWNGQMNLPRGNDRDKDDWDVSVTLTTVEVGPNPTCDIQMDGQDQKVSANQQIVQHYSFKSGGHLVDVSCSEGRIGSRPGNWNYPVHFDEKMTIIVSAMRKDDGTHPKIIK